MATRCRLVGVVGAATLLVTLLAVPVLAGVPSSEPTSCADSTDSTWQDNCWVSKYSSDPDRISDFSTGVQRIVAVDYWLGSIDGYYGTNSYNATKSYQSARGLTSDGIVGTNTWSELRSDLVAMGTISSYNYYSIDGDPAFRQQPTGDRYWQVESDLSGSFQWMDRTRST